MIPSAESRLSVVVAILILQILTFILELFIFVPGLRRDRWYIPLRQWYAPVGAAALGVILVPILFTGVYTGTEVADSTCRAGLDADVAGEGVRTGAWVQIGVLIIISLIGTFHPTATGAKEIGAGLVLTHISLAISLLVQIQLDTLSLADAAIGAMVLDGQNMALSIQLMSKETLAARWQVRTVVSVQVLGLVVLARLASQLLHGSLATDECSCLKVFWWAWLNNCAPSPRENTVFWTFYSLRCLCFLQASFHAIVNAPKFHFAEPKCGDEGNVYQKRGGILRGITYPCSGDYGPAAFYSEYPATVSFMYALYGVLALTSMSAAEVAIRDLNLRPTSAISSVGQVIAIVVAFATLYRALHLLVRMFLEAWGSTRVGFVSPFRGYTFSVFRRASYILAPLPLPAGNMIQLGHIFKDPPGPDFDPIGPPIEITDTRHHTRHSAFELICPETSNRCGYILRLLGCRPFLSRTTTGTPTSMKLSVLETKCFSASTIYIKRACNNL